MLKTASSHLFFSSTANSFWLCRSKIAVHAYSMAGLSQCQWSVLDCSPCILCGRSDTLWQVCQWSVLDCSPCILYGRSVLDCSPYTLWQVCPRLQSLHTLWQVCQWSVLDCSPCLLYGRSVLDCSPCILCGRSVSDLS